MKKTSISGIFEKQKGRYKQLYTRNQNPGIRVYGEFLNTFENLEYREWDTTKSKLASAIVKGVKELDIKKSDVVLYLGSSTGTTVSHLSDILTDGFIFAIDTAPRVMRELVFLSEKRTNIAPILADASAPGSFQDRVSQVDFVYQDISQKNQTEIFLKNIDLFLKPNGLAYLALKARSINVAQKPKQIFNMVKEKLKSKLKILDQVTLEPFQKDHCFFVCQKV